jgi:hypothetical protein
LILLKFGGITMPEIKKDETLEEEEDEDLDEDLDDEEF